MEEPWWGGGDAGVEVGYVAKVEVGREAGVTEETLNQYFIQTDFRSALKHTANNPKIPGVWV